MPSRVLSSTRADLRAYVCASLQVELDQEKQRVRELEGVVENQNQHIQDLTQQLYEVCG